MIKAEVKLMKVSTDMILGSFSDLMLLQVVY